LGPLGNAVQRLAGEHEVAHEQQGCIDMRQLQTRIGFAKCFGEERTQPEPFDERLNQRMCGDLVGLQLQLVTYHAHLRHHDALLTECANCSMHTATNEVKNIQSWKARRSSAVCAHSSGNTSCIVRPRPSSRQSATFY